MDNKDNTTKADQILVESLTRAAHAVVSAASTAGDCRQLQAIINLGLGDMPDKWIRGLDLMSSPPNLSPQPPQKKVRIATGSDDTIKKYRDGFDYAGKLLRQNDEHMEIKAMIAALDAESIAPFHKASQEQAKAWLSRYFGRNSGYRFNPVCKTSQTTMETEIWTNRRWRKKHQLSDGKPSGLQPSLV